MSILAIASGLISVAPTVAGWLGGDRAEEAAEKVVDIAKEITGFGSSQQAVDYLKSNPEMKAKFLDAIEERKHELDKLFLQDVKDARQSQIETLKLGKSRVSREFIYWYAAFATLFSCTYLVAITFIEIPESSVRFADTALGFILGTMLSAIINFFYGAAKPVKDDE